MLYGSPGSFGESGTRSHDEPESRTGEIGRERLGQASRLRADAGACTCSAARARSGMSCRTCAGTRSGRPRGNGDGGKTDLAIEEAHLREAVVDLLLRVEVPLFPTMKPFFGFAGSNSMSNRMGDSVAMGRSTECQLGAPEAATAAPGAAYAAPARAADWSAARRSGMGIAAIIGGAGRRTAERETSTACSPTSAP
eukprot:scaffold3767_cov114-Isochrysis_galbana.AAC.31